MIRVLPPVLAVVVAFVGLAAPASAQEESAEAPARLFDGLGAVEFQITTDSEASQTYFDQGLRLAYGFWRSEARRSFEAAIDRDPEAPMAYWGKAFTYGPYLNNGGPSADELETAYAAIQVALELKDRGSDKERAFIEALAARFDEDPEVERQPLDDAYWTAMREVARQFPDDLDAVTLAAAAYMNTTRWDYWTKAGQPKTPETDQFVAMIESVLARNPDHSGAIHYYIHAVEASANPDRAVPYADRLGPVASGIAHLVHMPSHVYIRVGEYEKAAESNRLAAIRDEAYISDADLRSRYPIGSYLHNVEFQWSAASLDGQKRTAIETAEKLFHKVVELTPVERRGYGAQRRMSARLFAYVRFGEWDQALGVPEPPEGELFSAAMWHYARGISLVGKRDLVGARTELAALDELLEDGDVLNENVTSIAANALAGELAAQEGRVAEAVEHLERAVQLQDDLRYSEPPPWYYPVRQSLGAVLLDAGRAAEAETVYRRDVEVQRDSGWGLFGLLQSLRAQGKMAEAADVERRFRAVWAKADTILTASRFQ